MRWLSARIVVTLVAAALSLTIGLPLVDLFTVNVFLVLFVPVVVLVLARVRPTVHWTLFVIIAAATAIVLVRIAQSDSSTAGFGVVVVPLLLTMVIIVAAKLDRFAGSPTRSRKPV